MESSEATAVSDWLDSTKLISAAVIVLLTMLVLRYFSLFRRRSLHEGNIFNKKYTSKSIRQGDKHIRKIAIVGAGKSVYDVQYL